MISFSINIFALVFGGISLMFQRRPRLSLDKCQVPLSPGANLQWEEGVVRLESRLFAVTSIIPLKFK